MPVTPCPAPGCDTHGPEGGWCARHKPLKAGDPVTVVLFTGPRITHPATVLTVTRNGHVLVRLGDGYHDALTVARAEIEAHL